MPMWNVVAAVVCIASGVLHGQVLASSTAPMPWVEGRPGPWGQLQTRRFYLAAPEEEVDAVLSRLLERGPIVWHFAETSVDDLLERFQQIGISLQRWPELDRGRLGATATTVQVRPSHQLVLQLTKTQRSTIYGMLAQSDRNDPYRHPARFDKTTFPHLLRNSGLSVTAEQTLAKLTYEDRGATALADAGLLIRSLSAKDQRSFVALLRAQPAVACRLKLTAGSDLTHIATYWGRWGRQPGLMSLLRAQLGGNHEVDVDISQVLPTFAAQRLYRYPSDFQPASPDTRADGFWTAVNFAAVAQEESPSSTEFSALMRQYYRVTPSPQLGDLVIWLGQSQQVIHAAAYVADDIVFTKNGAASTVPWVLSSLADVSRKYGDHTRYLARTHLPPPSVPSPLHEGWRTGHKGPWGTLETKWITIDWPDASVHPTDKPAGLTQWTMPVCASVAAVQAKLARYFPALDEDLLTIRQSAGAFVVLAEDDLVLSLTPPQRSEFYRYLSQDEANAPQRNPYSFFAPNLNRLIDVSSLKPSTKELIRKLSYGRGSTTLFADLHTLMRRIEGAAERVEAASVLTGHCSVMARVRLSPQTDLDAFTRYWQSPGGHTHIPSLIKSLRRRDENPAIDISLLVSPFISQHLYRFPDRPLDGSTVYPNCFWSVANFHKAGSQYANPLAFRNLLRQDFVGTAAPSYGDVVLFADEQGKVLHTALYIAGDVLFTKNGMDLHAPWILTTLSDSTAAYSAHSDLKIYYFRRREKTR